MKKNLKSYFSKREENVKILSGIPRHDVNAETFHKLRVEIKKIQALIDIMDHCLNKFDQKKANRKLKAVFRAAGRVRELDVLHETIRKHKFTLRLPLFMRKLKQKRSGAIDEYYSLTERQVRNKLNELNRQIGPGINRIKSKDIAGYFNRMKRELNSQLSGKLSNSAELHDLRKQMKIYYYNVKCIGSRKTPKDKLSEVIGEWHDCHVNIEHLKKGKKEIRNAKEAGVIQKIIDMQLHRREVLAKSIRLLARKVKLPEVRISDI